MARVRPRGAPPKDPTRRGRATQRQAFLATKRGDLDADELREALRVRRRQQAAEVAGLPRPRGSAREAPDVAQPHQWLPIGPTVVLAGQAGGRPRVAGRVTDVQVSNDGLRAYAATANGGVWFSPDGGESWQPLGGWTTTGSPPPIDRASGVLACGCLLVRFDPGNNAAADEVYVGTGELMPSRGNTLGGQNSGIGVLHATGPATSTIFAAPWTVEAANLANSGIFRLAEDPADATTLVAATSAGLWTRSGGPLAAWDQVAVAPFSGAAGAKLICTDVCWVAGAGATPTRLWVGVRDDAGASSGVWVSAHGLAGPFAQIALPALAGNPGLMPKSRLSLAPAPSNPAVVYALGEANQVWRFDNLTAVGVERIPSNLLGGQDAYNQAIAVHPTRPERLFLGGATEAADGEWSASLYLASVTAPAAGRWQYGFTTLALNADPTRDDAYVGHGVHADVHALRFVTVGTRNELWVGCDGGVFRSLRGNDDNRLVKNSFIARNNGMATLECGYVQANPAVEGHVIAGAQDNGTLERVGVSLWGRPFGDGDGGGVVFDPAAPDRFIGQVTNATFRGSSAVFTPPAMRTPTPAGTSPPAAEADEDSNTEFYTGIDAVLVPGAPATSRIAWGSWRVWLTPDSGATWRTLTSLRDPLSLGPPPAQDSVTDPCVTTATGRRDVKRGLVMALRWASPTRLYALCNREVLKYELVADAAATGGLRATRQALARQEAHKKEDPQAALVVASPGQRLPEIGFWSDLAVHDAGRGPHGSFYVATTGDPTKPDMDTVWWFDGTDRWHATGLRTGADAARRVPAPAYAVVVDKTDRNTVYVGTAVGVWRGVFDPGATSWGWFSMNNGLPEAAVQDLALHDEAATGQRVLRAAIQARGIWEVDLAQPLIGARTMLRVHAWDTRRQNPTPLADPKQPLPNAALSWHASPDVRVRPRRGSRPPAPSAPFPWVGASPDRYGLWVFQTALHARGAGDPMVKPDGQWTPLFDARLRAANGNSNRITRALWNSVVGSGASFADAYADPWNGSEPSEADLFELIVDRAPPGGSPASIGVGRVRVRVDVQVHHRSGVAVAANQVRVTLLRRDVTGTADAAWAALPCAWTAPVQTLLRNGGAPPALADGWSFADAAQAVRSPAGPVDARLSRTVAFDADLSAPAATRRVLFVAVVHSDADPVTLAGATLQAVVLGNRFVALRSVDVV